jgi:acetyl-CoA synthetase
MVATTFRPSWTIMWLKSWMPKIHCSSFTLPVLPENQRESLAGYMVYSAYTFKNVFNYEDNDIFWCTADIGWITGHSYILYGPLLNGATTVIFEGVPSYPDFSRFWQTIENIKSPSFTRHQQPLELWQSIEYVQDTN